MPKHKTLVCRCMDVSESDLFDAINQGFNHIETLKRFTGVCMGTCQGKMCMLETVKILAKELGRSPDEVYVPTIRPPVKPIPLGNLAQPTASMKKRQDTESET